jgi:hypothetical protein
VPKYAAIEVMDTARKGHSRKVFLCKQGACDMLFAGLGAPLSVYTKHHKFQEIWWKGVESGTRLVHVDRSQ